MTVHVLEGDSREVLKTLPETSVQTCVTSPPYFGLRDYGHYGQIGMEPTTDKFVSEIVNVFREVRRVLKDDGTVWLNIGDSYGSDKSLMGLPWRVAFAMKNDGWVLRQDIIWHKSNPMPEPAKDRCVRGHEYLFLFAKNRRYYFDSDAIKEPSSGTSGGGFSRKYAEAQVKHGAMNLSRPKDNGTRNKRSVWTTSVNSYRGAHFATFPERLIEPCILAGSREGDNILDPFGGSGTTGVVAHKLGRSATLIELNPNYANIARERIRTAFSLDM